MHSKRVLVLGGMREGEDVTALLREAHGIDTILVRPPSLKRDDASQPALHLLIERRSDLSDLMRGTQAVIVATHPYADRFTQVAAEIAAEQGLPCLRLLREPWRPGGSDRWIPVDSPRDAAAEVMRSGYRRPFVSLGRDQIEPFVRMRGRTVVFRLPQGGEAPDVGYGRLLATPDEVSASSETMLMRRHEIDVLVTRNIGGAGGMPKLQAARTLGLPVVMLRRPGLRDLEHRVSAEEAASWVETVLEPTEAVPA